MRRSAPRIVSITLLVLTLGCPTGAQTILQAHTAVDTLGFTIGPKLFQQSELDSLAKAKVHVDSLIVYPRTIYVTEGASFELKDMYVIALDSEGKQVQKAPLEVRLSAFNCTLGTERIMGFRRGKATLQVISLLPMKQGKTRTGVEVGIQITPWPN